MTEEKQQSHSVSVLYSVLNRLKSNQKVQTSSLHTSKWYIHPKDTDQSDCVTVDKLESNFQSCVCSETTNDPFGLEGTAMNNVYEEITKTEEFRSPPSIFNKWEGRNSMSNPLHNLMGEKEEGPETSKSQLESGNVRAEPCPEEEPSGTESNFNSVKDSMTQEGVLLASLGTKQLSLSTLGPSFIKDSTVSEMESGATPSKSPQINECNLNFDRKQKNKTQESSNDDKYNTRQSLDTSNCFKTSESPNCRPTRSVSDPVSSSIIYERSLSVSNNLCPDMDKVDMHGLQKNKVSEQEAMLMADTQKPMNNDGSKVQKKGKTKNIAQKLKAKFKQKNSPEENNNRRRHHEDEEARSVTSTEEAESPVGLLPSPTLSAKDEESSPVVHIRLQRVFTLRDFKLNLEPINLLEEVFSGEEWARFLPDKESPSEADINSQPQPEISEQLDDVLYQNLDTKQEISKNKDHSQPDIDQISDIPSDKVIPLRQRQGQSNSIIFAVPKALISNGAVKQRKSEVPQHDLSDEEDVYDFVEVYMLPKEDPLHMSKAKDQPLDLSAVKSLGMLDNSALKSRIHLSKKRKHRPPKKRKKEKSKATPKSKFYTSWTSMDLPDHISASTNSSSVQSPFSNCTNPTSSCDSEATPDPTPAEEKEKASEMAMKPKT